MSQPASENSLQKHQSEVSSRVAYSDWVRLRSLILLRWMAIFGQTSATLVAWKYYQVDLNIAWCLAVIGAAVLANLVAGFWFPENKRLSETEMVATLLFDTSQLAVLLYLTGGLNNPFALLILAPATIAATAVKTRATVFVSLVTIAAVTFVAFVHKPLRMLDGSEITIPPLFGFGFWLAIVIGVIFLSLYARRVASEIHSMGNALLATQMALAREQKLTDLGGVVAATAHELGTPLATIKLVSSELAADLAAHPDLLSDAELIREQADRCRDILRSMGRVGKDDLHMRTTPLSALIRESAEPHIDRGKTILFELSDDAATTMRPPTVLRSPEIIHGLRNLIQNAVDFAQSRVWVDADWDDNTVTIWISDDGEGYPAHLLGRIGDPFMRHRRDEHRTSRPEYDGMGLGLFIAKTLLERTGASLTFTNGGDPFLTEDERPERSGAIVRVQWPRARIEVTVGALAENVRIIV